MLTAVEVDILGDTSAYASHWGNDDVGKAIRSKNVIGQIMGGVATGTGCALMKEFVSEKTTSFIDYFIPTTKDV